MTQPLSIADYAKNDVNFVLSVLSLEELGARGNKGLTGLVDNPVHSAAIAGLATSATAQATIEVRIWCRLLSTTCRSATSLMIRNCSGGCGLPVGTVCP